MLRGCKLYLELSSNQRFQTDTCWEVHTFHIIHVINHLSFHWTVIENTKCCSFSGLCREVQNVMAASRPLRLKHKKFGMLSLLQRGIFCEWPHTVSSTPLAKMILEVSRPLLHHSLRFKRWASPSRALQRFCWAYAVLGFGWLYNWNFKVEY